ncbi:hypothetical protein [Streptomyces cavernae]|uniref:hypothetical protein n=1 Tax=Streptomyces cavernae TaxID=2259034 RepID=UPI000FEBD9A9|nr:hypothetical protein [Streptomyces cavernae]
MRGVAGEVWRAVRPVGTYQRLLWWCGSALIASGAVHGVVAVVDGTTWWGPVAWRKPVVFGLSFGLLVWSVVWILRSLPERWWVGVPAGLVAFTSVAEVLLITLQRWRGVASHFNQSGDVNSGIWSAIGTLVLPLVLGLAWLLVDALVRFRGGAVARIAVVAGLLAVLGAGAIGSDMARIGETAFDETGQVPWEVVFGAAGSAKLAHAAGLHGLQVLALLAVALDTGRGPDRTSTRVMLLGAAGYAAVFGSITATAYDGRAPQSPSAGMALLLGAGALALVCAAAVAVSGLRTRPRRPVPGGVPSRRVGA